MGQAHAETVADHGHGKGCAPAQQLEHRKDDTQFGRLQGQAMAQALEKCPQADLPGTEQEEKSQRCISRRRKSKQ
ncbi:hypothetical protein D3C85_1610180 [compost metagenome]